MTTSAARTEPGTRRQFHIYVECPSCGSKMKVLPGFSSPLSRYVACDNMECSDVGKSIFIDMISGEGTYAGAVLGDSR